MVAACPTHLRCCCALAPSCACSCWRAASRDCAAARPCSASDSACSDASTDRDTLRVPPARKSHRPQSSGQLVSAAGPRGRGERSRAQSARCRCWHTSPQTCEEARGVEVVPLERHAAAVHLPAEGQLLGRARVLRQHPRQATDQRLPDQGERPATATSSRPWCSLAPHLAHEHVAKGVLDGRLHLVGVAHQLQRRLRLAARQPLGRRAHGARQLVVLHLRATPPPPPRARTPRV